MKTYTMYLNYKDTYICKFPTTTTDPYVVYEVMGKDSIRDAFSRGINYKRQIEVFKQFCDLILKKKQNCYKIRASDYLLFCSSYLALLKYKQIDYNDIIFLKNKKNLKLSKKKLNIKNK